MKAKKGKAKRHITKCGFRLLRLVGTIVLWTVFLIWAFGSLEKFMSRPTSSNVAFTNGDDDKGNFEMPSITICFSEFRHLYKHRLKEANMCASKGYMAEFNLFHEYLTACLVSEKYLTTTTTTEGSLFGCFDNCGSDNPPIIRFNTLKEFLTLMHVDISDLVDEFVFGEDITITLNMDKETREYWLNFFWTPFFDMLWGPCFTFDPSLHNFTLTSKARMEMRFKFNVVLGQPVGQKYELIIHDRFEDRFDAFQRNPMITIEKKNSYDLKISKTVIEKLNREERKCIEEQYYGFEKCTHIKTAQKFIDKFNCTLPWMANSYEFIQDHNSCELGSDDGFDFIHFVNESLNMHESVQKDCPKYLPCKRSIYEDQMTQKSINEDSNTTMSRFILRFSSPYIQVIQDSWSYDEQSFIGEVGGTLGLFLGFSFSSLFDLLEYFLNKL